MEIQELFYGIRRNTLWTAPQEKVDEAEVEWNPSGMDTERDKKNPLPPDGIVRTGGGGRNYLECPDSFIVYFPLSLKVSIGLVLIAFFDVNLDLV